MLYGTIYGDIAGSTYEFRSVTNYNFTTVPAKSRFTDDTVMTCAVALWLIEDEKHLLSELVKQMQRLGQMFPRAGYGGMFRKWLVTKDPKPYGSFGNGSAMRVSPCAWVAKSLEEAEYLAEQTAIVTHDHPEGIKGARAVAAAIYMAKTGASKEDIKNYITEKYGYNLDRTIAEIKKMGYSFDSTCQGSVPESIIAFLEGNSYEETVRLAILLGGDADTQAAIAGSIAEAFYGFPTRLTVDVDRRLDRELMNIVNKFNNYCNRK